MSEDDANPKIEEDFEDIKAEQNESDLGGELDEQEESDLGKRKSKSKLKSKAKKKKKKQFQAKQFFEDEASENDEESDGGGRGEISRKERDAKLQELYSRKNPHRVPEFLKKDEEELAQMFD